MLFVTNNSSKSREAYVAKFRGLGLDVDASEVRRTGGRGEAGQPGWGCAARFL